VHACVCVYVCVRVCVCICVCFYAYVCVCSIPHELSTCLIAKTLFLPVSIFCRTIYAVPMPPLPSCFNTSYLSISKTLLQHVEQTLPKKHYPRQNRNVHCFVVLPSSFCSRHAGHFCSSSLLSLTRSPLSRDCLAFCLIILLSCHLLSLTEDLFLYLSSYLYLAARMRSLLGSFEWRMFMSPLICLGFSRALNFFRWFRV